MAIFQYPSTQIGFIKRDRTNFGQECFADPDGRASYEALVGISWMVADLEKDAIPRTPAERVAEMKRRAEGFAEPLLSMIKDIPDDATSVTGLRIADFPCVPWDNPNGLVTLAGDSAHGTSHLHGNRHEVSACFLVLTS